jgi:hypothetical protein
MSTDVKKLKVNKDKMFALSMILNSLVAVSLSNNQKTKEHGKAKDDRNTVRQSGL